jgi:hypothetical protein
MNTELNAPQLTDQALFLPAFLLFASLLIGLYLFTAPPGGNVVQAMFATSGPAAGGNWVKVALLGG